MTDDEKVRAEDKYLSFSTDSLSNREEDHSLGFTGLEKAKMFRTCIATWISGIYILYQLYLYMHLHIHFFLSM